MNELWLFGGDFSYIEGSPSFAGGILLVGDDPISRARAALNNLLKGKNPCAEFFNQGATNFATNSPGAPTTGADAINAANIVKDPSGPSQIVKSADQNGNIVYSQPYGAKTIEGGGPSGTIDINPNGAFYKTTAFVRGTTQTMGLTIGGTENPHQFAGDTLQAQMTILLHEMAHLLNMIPSDGSNPNQSLRNTQTILDHCKSDIAKAK
jgi:hypothetical protein